jgi:hypothetical protein
MLYGDRYAFRMSNPPGGGCRVDIRLPTGTRPAASMPYTKAE